MRLWIALWVAGCSLEGFSSGGAGGAPGAGGSGGAGGTGGSGGGCPACTCTPWRETAISTVGPAMDPSLARTGSGWAVAWQDARDGNNEIYFAPLDLRGVKLGPELRVTTDPAETQLPVLVWNGTRHAIAYEDARTGNAAAYVAWIDEAGTAVTLDLEVWKGTGAPRAPAIAWGGTSYVMVWEDFRDSSYELRKGVVTDAATVENVDQAVNSASGNELSPALTFGAFEYGLVWQDDRDGDIEIYFARLDATGTKIGSETRVTDFPGESRGPSIAWTGTGYGVTWTDTRDGPDRVYFARLSEGGVKEAPEIAVGDGWSPSIVWDGTGYAVAWETGNAVQFARLGANGSVLGSGPIASAPYASQPSLAWSGFGYAVAWQREERGGTPAVFFSDCAP